MIHSHLSFILNDSKSAARKYTLKLRELIIERLNSVLIHYYAIYRERVLDNIYIVSQSLLLPRGMKL